LAEERVERCAVKAGARDAVTADQPAVVLLRGIGVPIVVNPTPFQIERLDQRVQRLFVVKPSLLGISASDRVQRPM